MSRRWMKVGLVAMVGLAVLAGLVAWRLKRGTARRLPACAAALPEGQLLAQVAEITGEPASEMSVTGQREDYRRSVVGVALTAHNPPVGLAVDAATGVPLTVRCRGLTDGRAGSPQLDAEEAKSIALEAMERWFGGLPDGYELTKDRLYDGGSLGWMYSYQWREKRKGAWLPNYGMLTLDAVSGEVGHASLIAYPVVVDLDARVSQAAAEKRALAYAQEQRWGKREGVDTTTDAHLEVTFGETDATHNTQRLVWAVGVTSKRRPSGQVGPDEECFECDVFVDALNGRAVGYRMCG